MEQIRELQSQVRIPLYVGSENVRREDRFHREIRKDIPKSVSAGISDLHAECLSNSPKSAVTPISNRLGRAAE